MHSLLGDRFIELKNHFLSAGLPAHRANQIFGWIYRKFNFDFNEMSDLPKNFRADLAANYRILELTRKDILVSPEGETVKFLFETSDNQFVESVLIFHDEEESEPGEARVTLCISCQAGCPLGCRFCATGALGFQRDLTTAEIVSQVLLCEETLHKRPEFKEKQGRIISNIVYMGMGEPLLNYAEVLKSIEILSYSGGYLLGARHFTISTAGIIPGIAKLALEPIQLRLALSLHTAFQNIREDWMPVSKKYPLTEVISALKDYQLKTNRRITLEYILFKNKNLRPDDARELRSLLAGLDYNLNLIVYNPVEGLPFEKPEDSEIRNFEKELSRLGIPFVIRRSKGSGIKAGCGQLGLFWKNTSKNSSAGN